MKCSNCGERMDGDIYNRRYVCENCGKAIEWCSDEKDNFDGECRF